MRGDTHMNTRRSARTICSLLAALAFGVMGLLGPAAPALAKAKVYTFYVDSRGGVLYYHRTKSCTYKLPSGYYMNMNGSANWLPKSDPWSRVLVPGHVKTVRATVAAMLKAGYRPCPGDKPAGYAKPPKRFYASKYAGLYTQNKKAAFITKHRGGRLTLTWKQVVARKLTPDPKTKPYGWVGFKSYVQSQEASFIDAELAEINRERAVLGNPPVSLSATRNAACTSWADHLIRVKGVTGHVTPHTSGQAAPGVGGWAEPQSIGAGCESVWWTHYPVLHLLTGEDDGHGTWNHVYQFVADPTIAYIGVGAVYQRGALGWDGYFADCIQSDADHMRGGTLTVSGPALSASAGATATATVVVDPPTPGDTFTWTVANPAIVSVTGTGASVTVAPLQAGTTTISVHTGVSQIDATATVTVAP